MTRRRTILAMAVWCVAAILCGAPGARAQQQASCTSSVSNLSFGVVDMTTGAAVDSTATYSISCTGRANRTVRLCLNIGEGAGGSSGGHPRLMSNGASSMQYGLFTNAARTTIWGSYYWSFPYYAPQVDLPLGPGGAASTNVTVYGRILANQQTLTTGTYQSSFAGQVVTEYGYTGTDDCVTGNFITGYAYPSFTASANYQPTCRVSAGNMAFPTTGLLSANVDAISSLSMTCSNGTAWTTGLGNGTGVGASGPTNRKMTGPSGATITYGLYRDAARSLPWGASVGSAATGTGAGTAQSVPVYGRVPPQTTPAPATYTDTIVVTVTY